PRKTRRSPRRQARLWPSKEAAAESFIWNRLSAPRSSHRGGGTAETGQGAGETRVGACSTADSSEFAEEWRGPKDDAADDTRFDGEVKIDARRPAGMKRERGARG